MKYCARYMQCKNLKKINTVFWWSEMICKIGTMASNLSRKVFSLFFWQKSLLLHFLMLAPRSSIFCKQEQKRFSQNVSFFCFVLFLFFWPANQGKAGQSIVLSKKKKKKFQRKSIFQWTNQQKKQPMNSLIFSTNNWGSKKPKH